MDILRAYIPIEITHPYDIAASVEFEFDEGLFTLKLSEIEKDEEGRFIAEQSHQQSPLNFENNNDHFRSVIRTLDAQDVVSTDKHILQITSREPDFLHIISPDAASDACMFIGVKIAIKSSKLN
jgi:hypothetical protein